MGSAADVLKYEFPVTALQFDTRKIVACTGENGIDVGLEYFAIMWDFADFLHRPTDLQPNGRNAFQADDQWPRQARRTPAFHGQIPGQWWQGWARKGLGSVDQLLFVAHISSV
jgi:hypothetical protein